MNTVNCFEVEYEGVNKMPAAVNHTHHKGMTGKKKKIVLLLSMEIIIMAIIILVTIIEPIVNEYVDKKEYFESIEKTQGALIDSNYEAAIRLQEMVLNSESAWYDEDDKQWVRPCTIYTTYNVDDSFIRNSLGDNERKYTCFIGEKTSLTDYLIWGFNDKYYCYDYELYENSGVVEWNIDVYSNVSPEDQELITSTAQKIAGKAIGSDSEKIRTITKEIGEMLTYEVIDGDNLATVIRGGKGCCRHYADLFFLACTYAGIDSRIILGNCEIEGDHAWNIVEVDGKWYHVDPTWEDEDNNNWVLLGSETISENRELYSTYEKINEIYDISEEDYAA